MIRFAVIGTNFITTRMLASAKLCSDFRLTTVYSRDIEKARLFASDWGASNFTNSLDELAESTEVDAVYIASPNCCHTEQAIKMMRAKKHVLCEKPIAKDSAQLREMLEVAEENGVVLLEAMRPAFMPTLNTLRKAMQKIGIIRRCTLSYCQYSSRYDMFKNGIVENAFNPAFFNGALMDIGVYCVHIMVMLFGMPNNISATGWFLPKSIDAYGSAICDYEGMCVQIAYSKINQSNSPSEIHGEKGVIRFAPTATPYTVEVEYNDGTTENIKTELLSHDMIYELEEFIRLVNTGSSCKTWHDYSINAMSVIDEMRRQIGIDFVVR